MTARENVYAEMKRYVRFSDADVAALRAFGGFARPHFPRISEEFYERIREHEDAHAVFTGEEQIARLKRSLVRWMEQLCTGPYDQAYYDERAKIGRIHVRIGLPQRYMFTAMALIRAELQAIAATMPEGQAAAVQHTLARALDLELAIMLETYNEDFALRLQRIERDERVRLERALARSEDRYARAVDLARMLVIGLDGAAQITLFNHEAERVTGYARDQAIGRPFVELLLPERLHEGDGARLVAAAAGRVPIQETLEAPLRTRAGKERIVRWQLAYSPTAHDEGLVVFAMGTDVTEERALLERTMQTEKLAAVGTLAAGLAHEIRNPLNGALLHVTFLERALQRSGGHEEALETARFIGTEIRRLSVLVKEFLIFARPAPSDLKKQSLRAICQRAVDVLEDEARTASAELVTDYGAADVLMRLDAAKVEQVVLNLVKNAIDAVAGTDGGRVIVRTRREPRQAIIEVEDDGPGLPSADAPIFDAFYSTKASGTGLGLAIVHRLVTDHGGEIDVQSRAGKTIFRVALPIGADVDPDEEMSP
jgi:PAS domain S-box-containing protein